MVDVCVLGTGGMMPLPNRFLAAGLIRIGGKLYLIDCGEATQITMKSLGWGFKDIDYICITHFHADHVSGLPGVLLTIGNSDRVEPLTIVGPAGIRNIVGNLRAIAPELPFEINFVEIGRDGLSEYCVNADEAGGAYLSAIYLEHSLPCVGYGFELRRLGKFDLDKARALNIPVKNWNYLQHGQTVEVDGKIYTPESVMGDGRKGIKVAYVTDTRPTRAIPRFINGADLFICEGLYGDDERRKKAMERKHMVFSEAAKLAKEGEVDKLWLTHFSPSMPDPMNYLNYAKNIFPNSYVCKDRAAITLTFEE